MATDLFAVLHQKYLNWHPAQALLFYSGPAHGWKALRLIVPQIGKEFTDNVYIGRDPEGSFYYDDVKSIDEAIYYYSERVINPKDNRPMASIKFFRNPSPQGTGNPVAEFLGYDPYGNIMSSEMDGYASAREGEWKVNTTTNNVIATVRKSSNSSAVILDASGSIGKTATLAGSEMPDELKAASLNVRGTLYYKTMRTLPNAKFVNYNNDRLVLYDNDYSGKDFNAFFFPYTESESVPKSLGVETVAATFTLDQVTWESE